MQISTENAHELDRVINKVLQMHCASSCASLLGSATDEHHCNLRVDGGGGVALDAVVLYPPPNLNQ